jgi:energy-coupling factor transporter ATP-binding protein EcfA2
MGPTGAGKTTLALALLGIIPQSYGGRIRGRVLVEGLDTRDTPVSRIAGRLGLVFEDPESQFLMNSVEDEIAFGLENLALPADEIRRRINEILATLGIAGFEQRTPHGLSGGEKQRVALAAILAMRPRLLVLDEPAGRLDHAGVKALQSALDRWRGQTETGLIIISNDSDWVRRLADRVLILDAGRMVGLGGAESVLTDARAMAAAGLDLPSTARLTHHLRTAGIPLDFNSLETAADKISHWLTTTMPQNSP